VSICRPAGSVKRLRTTLLRLNPGAGDDVMPFLDIGGDAISELLRRARVCLDT